ncbi:protein lethal(2)essential for life-like [Leptinotarsa decemlineata]|uniref:protein lethal(2)essential for life-like n=1 Tax=Leptinotarsa decemlineata TaxID=7539 RepID=UPI003D3087C7
MSLYPFFDDYYYQRPTHRPSRLLDQHFGLGLSPDDFLEALTVPRMVARCPAGYMRPWRTELSRQDTGSTVSLDKDRFQANLDVQQFKPEEITVKLTDENTITIEGKHEEKQDDHGFISRHFVRRYVLPKNCDPSQLQSKLSSDGVLTITAPTKNQEIEHKEIPIQQTGQPAKSIGEKKSEKNSEP